MASKANMDVADAIKILIGAGVRVDKVKKTQTWTLGMKVSDKMVKAAAVLDAQLVDDGNGGQKPEWRTRWVHPKGCKCASCIASPLASIRKHLPVFKEAA